MLNQLNNLLKVSVNLLCWSNHQTLNIMSWWHVIFSIVFSLEFDKSPKCKDAPKNSSEGGMPENTDCYFDTAKLKECQPSQLAKTMENDFPCIYIRMNKVSIFFLKLIFLSNELFLVTNNWSHGMENLSGESWFIFFFLYCLGLWMGT